MDRTEDSGEPSTSGLSEVRESADVDSHPSIEPDSWRDVTEFVDQFSDPVFGVLGDAGDGPKGFWIVRDIQKVRPAAIPIDQPPTFKMNVLGPDGTVIDALRLTIEKIERVRVAEPSHVD